MKRIAAMFVLLILLSSCGKSASPSPTPQDPSPPPPTASSEPTPSPAPEYPPSVVEAFKNGELVIEPNGDALNYQPWLDFISTLDTDDPASLTVYLPMDNESGLHFSARKAVESAVWQETSGLDADVIEGRVFTYSYDAPTGWHILYLNYQRVLSFIYFAPSHNEIASHWGYVPLEEIAPHYTWNEALADGCLVITDSIENEGMLTAFAGTLGFDEGCFLRVYEADDQGGAVLVDISFDGKRAYITHDATRAKTGQASTLSTQLFDDCKLTMIDTEDSMTLQLFDHQTKAEHTILRAMKSA